MGVALVNWGRDFCSLSVIGIFIDFILLSALWLCGQLSHWHK